MRIYSLRMCWSAMLAMASLQSAFCQDLQWLSHFGDAQTFGNGGFELVLGANGSLYGCGRLGSPGLTIAGAQLTVQGHSDELLVKLDAEGVPLWGRIAGGDCSPVDVETGEAIAYDSVNDRVIFAGSYFSEATFGAFTLEADCNENIQTSVAAYSASGDCLWAASGRGERVVPYGILVQAGITTVFGHSMSGATFAGTPDRTVSPGAYIARYGTSGELLGARRIMVNGFVDCAMPMEANWLVCGNFFGNDSLWDVGIVGVSSGTDGFVAVMDPSGTPQWVSTVSSDSAATVYECAVLPTGDVVVAGTFVENAFFPSDTLNGPEGTQSIFVARYSSTGDFIWATSILDATYLRLRQLAAAPDGSIYVKGRFKNDLTVGSEIVHATSSEQVFVMRFSGEGQSMGAIAFGRAVPTSRGGLAVSEAGVFVSNNYDSTLVIGEEQFPHNSKGLPDVYIAKFAPVLGFTGMQSLEAEDTTLRILANPNDGRCTVQLPKQVVQGGRYTLTITDTQGRVVQQVPLVFSDQGVVLDIRAEARGLYHVELSNSTSRFTGSIVFE